MKDIASSLGVEEVQIERVVEEILLRRFGLNVRAKELRDWEREPEEREKKLSFSGGSENG